MPYHTIPYHAVTEYLQSKNDSEARALKEATSALSVQITAQKAEIDRLNVWLLADKQTIAVLRDVIVWFFFVMWHACMYACMYLSH